MGKVLRKTPVKKNGYDSVEHVSKLGKELQKLADAYVASGGKLLNRRELDREIAERRGVR